MMAHGPPYLLRNLLTGWEGGVTREMYEDRISAPEFVDPRDLTATPDLPTELPEDTPHRKYLSGQVSSLAELRAIEEDGGALEDLDHIGESRADDLRRFMATYE